MRELFSKDIAIDLKIKSLLLKYFHVVHKDSFIGSG